MKKIFLVFLMFSFLSCSDNSNKTITECLESSDTKLLYEGMELFENILKEFYSNENLVECYYLYFNDLTIASENLTLLESNSKAIEFLKKIKKLKKVDFFWSKINATKYNHEHYFINKGKYLDCLTKTSKTKEFKDFFNQLKDANFETPPAVVASGLLYSKPNDGKVDLLTIERELSAIYFAFHFYYESILNNEINKKTR